MLHLLKWDLIEPLILTKFNTEDLQINAKTSQEDTYEL